MQKSFLADVLIAMVISVTIFSTYIIIVGAETDSDEFYKAREMVSFTEMVGDYTKSIDEFDQLIFLKNDIKKLYENEGKDSIFPDAIEEALHLCYIQYEYILLEESEIDQLSLSEKIEMLGYLVDEIELEIELKQNSLNLRYELIKRFYE